MPYPVFLRCCLMLVCWLTVRTTSQAQLSPSKARVDSLFAEWDRPGRPGAAVGVVHAGKLVYVKGFGEADLESGRPITAHTKFHVASVTKQFTAYALILLAQQGRLSLDDDIRRHVPEVPSFGSTVTLRQLLHHTSGLRDQWPLIAMAGRRLEDVITQQQVLDLVRRQQALNFEPGREWSYSNTGYTLLAEVVARVGGSTFRAWMQGQVFGPLQMEDTFIHDDHQQLTADRAHSYTQAPGLENTYREYTLNYDTFGATGLMTSVTDLAKWLANFGRPQVGSQATVAQFLQRGRLNGGDTLSYASGVDHGLYQGVPYFGHGGGDAGFRAYVCYFPGPDYGFIVLSNQAEFDPARKAFELATVFLQESTIGQRESTPPIPVAAPHPVDPALLDRYSGDYELDGKPGFFWSLSREGDRLLVRVTGQGRADLRAASDTTFSAEAMRASLTFHRPGTDGEPRLTIRQQGRILSATRVRPFTGPAGEYVGSYYSPELETVYTIESEGGTLRLAHIHNGEVPLKIVTRDRFQSPWWFAQSIAVVRDAGDSIIGLRMSNGRVHNLWLERLPDGVGKSPGKSPH